MQLHVMLTAELPGLRHFQHSKQLIGIYTASAKAAATHAVCSAAQEAQIAA